MIPKRFYAFPLRRLSAMLQLGEVTSLELTEACLSRLETLGPKYNAVVTVMRDRALDEARARRGRDRAPASSAARCTASRTA